MAKKISKTNPQPRSAPRRSPEGVFGQDKKNASEASRHDAAEEDTLEENDLEEERAGAEREPELEELPVAEASEPEDEEEEVAAVRPVKAAEPMAEHESFRAPAAGRTAADAPAAPRPRLALGKQELATAAGLLLFALISGALFFKFLYAHSAPLDKEELARQFATPLKGSLVTIESATAAWRSRAEGDRAQSDETVLPTLALALAPGQASAGFVRVEFVDTEAKLRGDVYVLAVEGGKFKDSGRGEAIEEGGLKAVLTGTVGFKTQVLYATYSTGDEPRWSVRIKEGTDASDGPWNLLGAAEIPNK